ncbi:heme biosynthesis operon protein HemX [Veronia nyctiphanis]|uniref:Heme biosynthesis operon protein HemX n=1 Tax=Veronia nyctiphanis TaxID=1278244 RepID=A0A4Q0YPW1_9GAMM|nr:uroporphyrinogen-III C-methyltransferase [Veronia nyctiphanis]RXJ72623.1 heme biosynthesis operon protein HemX [Veronia nyctiphanis]
MTDNKNTKDSGTNKPETTNTSNKKQNVKPTESTQKNNDSSTIKGTQAEPEKAKEGKGGKALGVIAIVLVLAMGGGLYYHGHMQSDKMNANVSALAKQIDSLKSELSTNTENARQALASATQKQNHQQTIIEQQAQTIESLQTALADMKGRRPNDWLLAEADYLVKQAGRKLWLEHDVMSATSLMQTADRRIAELNDPSLTPVRKALANDITALKAIKRIDRDGIVLRLAGLQQQISGLPLANAVLPKAEEAAAPVVSNSVNDWQDNLKASLNEFVGQFVTYRKRDGSVIPLLTPTQTFRLQENVKTKLDQAITAVYREQGRLYNESLTMAEDWIKRFYNLDAASTQSVLAELEQLNLQTVEVNYPEKLSSQTLISDLVADRLQRNLAHVDGEDDGL